MERLATDRNPLEGVNRTRKLKLDAAGTVVGSVSVRSQREIGGCAHSNPGDRDRRPLVVGGPDEGDDVPADAGGSMASEPFSGICTAAAAPIWPVTWNGSERTPDSRRGMRTRCGSMPRGS